MTEALYDTIGIDYANLRRPDPRIAAIIESALGDARAIVNVGAGAGSYEPAERDVTAVEPSAEMIGQRPPDAAPAVQASAEVLPFADDSFDAAMAVLTVHHWENQRRGLEEMRRVARHRVVILTFDPEARPWLTDYFPELAILDEAQMPAMDFYGEVLGPVRVEAVPVPRDCTDGFLYAYWARPDAYLDERLRAGSSSFWKLGEMVEGCEKLRADLESGAWHRRYGELLGKGSYDAGYRLVTADLG